MSMHRVLAEIKTYNDRITAAMNTVFVVANKKSNERIGSKTIPEVSAAIEGNFKSVESLVENKKRLEAMKIKSNSETIVEIAGKKYTVAEAIVRKELLKLEEKYLASLKNQYMREKNRVEAENNQLPAKLEQYLQSVLGASKDSRSATEVEEHTKSFMGKNTFELIDPAKVEDKIKALETEIINFKTNVDYVLSETNATTFVDVEFVD